MEVTHSEADSKNNREVTIITDFLAYLAVSADWTVQNAPKGVYMNTTSMENVTAYLTYNKQTGGCYLPAEKEFTKKMRSVFDSSKYVFYSNYYKNIRRWFGHSGKKTTKAKVVFGIQPTIYVKRPSLNNTFYSLRNFKINTKQGDTDYVKLLNGDVVRIMAFGNATASIPGNPVGSTYGYFAENENYGKRLSYSNVKLLLNNMLVWNTIKTTGLSASAESAGVAGGLMKFSFWNVK